MCNRWLLVRFDALGAISVLMATVGAIMGGASAGLAGIVITQAQQYVRAVCTPNRFSFFFLLTGRFELSVVLVLAILDRTGAIV